MAHSRQRGDTLVEVLMAIVILSVVIVGAMTMMTRGLAAAQIALEHSQVRMSINGQFEMLRFARDARVKNPTDPSSLQWNAIIAGSNTTPIAYNDNTCGVTGGKTGFYMSKNASQVTRTSYTPASPPLLPTPGTGMWIESVLSASGVRPAYVDFVIRACWQGSGGAGQQRTVTAARLYDPTR